MNVELAEYLIGLDKYILDENEMVQSFEINIAYPMSFRLTLHSPTDPDQSLLVNIKESNKRALKLSLHHQDNSTQNGLMRIDYYGRHINPSEVTEAVPELYRPFAGMWLDEYPGHIHYVVDGYKPLAWAIPLEIDDFPIKDIKDISEYTDLLDAFFHKINLKTKITYNHQMRLL